MSQDYKLSKNIWDQLKSLRDVDLQKALEKDPNFEQLPNTKGGSQIYFKRLDNRLGAAPIVRLDMHPSNKGGYGRELLSRLLSDIHWTKEEMKELKLISKKS